ncbi:hypothetical protein MRBLRH13_001453 [Agrobacterium radiobacter]|uniref:hypothetical protein n=1 Tax=Agrobacterium radiobacter TaxID=362 RepID=UPI003427C83C
MAGRKESEKPIIFEHLFNQRYDYETREFTFSTITQDEIQEAIVNLAGDMGLRLKPGNPANFLKDYLRSWSRNYMWPTALHQAKFTARQVYGGSRVFDFVPYASNQVEPFPDEFPLPNEAAMHELEAISLPSAARALGRQGESWLIQVIVQQRVLQTHFALFSKLKAVDLFHLQNGMKGTPEIDAVFLLNFMHEGVLSQALITLEAKNDDPILPDQIRAQVAYIAKQCQIRPALQDIKYVVPIAAATRHSVHPRTIQLHEMEPISVLEAAAAQDAHQSHTISLRTMSSVGYTFRPQIAGI